MPQIASNSTCLRKIAAVSPFYNIFLQNFFVIYLDICSITIPSIISLSVVILPKKNFQKNYFFRPLQWCYPLRLGWEVMLHPPYSLDLAPSDYYLFRSLQNSLNGKTCNDDKAVKSHLVQFFADKDQKFYERGIIKLPER